MEIQVDFINQHNRVSNSLSHELVKNRKHRLLARRHFLDVIAAVAVIQDEIELVGSRSRYGIKTSVPRYRSANSRKNF